MTMGRDHDPKYFLQVENRRRNVFVTQLGELRLTVVDLAVHQHTSQNKLVQKPYHCHVCWGCQCKQPEVPCRKSWLKGTPQEQVPSDILQIDRKTLQWTLRLRKEAEFNEVTAELIQKKQEFSEKMEALAKRTEKFIQKSKANRMRILYFDPYLQTCDEKMKYSVKKYHRERALNKIKTCEVQNLKEELNELQFRLEKLQKKMANYRKIEDYLQKVTDMLPTIYLECGEDSLVDTLRQRHQTLLFTNQMLMENLLSLQQNFEETQHEFEMLQVEHETAKIVLLTRISQLQDKSHTLQRTNVLAEDLVNWEANFLRYRKKSLNEMLYGISNMAEQCYMPHYGPLEEMPLLTKLDMIQEFFLEKKDIKQQTAQTPRSGILIESPGTTLHHSPSKKRVLSIEKLYLP